MARPRRVLLGVLAALTWALLGASTALATVALHARWWGLLLGLVVTLAWLVAAAPGPGRVGYAAGWAGFVGYVVVPRPEGDFLLARTGSAYAVLGTALLLVVVALATIGPRPVQSSPTRSPAGLTPPRSSAHADGHEDDDGDRGR